MAKITLADGMTIEGTAEELRELAKAFGEVAEAAEKEVPEFKVGDYAKITGAGDKPPYLSHKFPIGSIVKVDEVGDNEYGGRFLGKRIDGAGHGWWVLNEYAVKATVEEVADALGEDAEETAPEPAEEVIEGDPQVGDKILVVNAHLTNGKYDNGDILTVEDFYYRDIIGRYVAEVGEDKPYLHREEFVIIERAGEEAAEETIKPGDLIRFTENFFGVKEGEIVEVVTGANIDGDIKYRDRDGEIWLAKPKRFELVAKKADRKDV